MLGGQIEAGQPILYGSAKEKLEQLKSYSGKDIEEMRKQLEKEIEDEENEQRI